MRERHQLFTKDFHMNIYRRTFCIFCTIILFSFLAPSISIAGTKGKNGMKKTKRGAVEKTITGVVSMKKSDNDLSRIYMIGKMSISKTLEAKVKEFEGQTVTVNCSVHQGRILRIKSISSSGKK
jgi:hypothetical protein